MLEERGSERMDFEMKEEEEIDLEEEEHYVDQVKKVWRTTRYYAEPPQLTYQRHFSFPQSYEMRFKILRVGYKGLKVRHRGQLQERHCWKIIWAQVMPF